jgi:predicted dehydrogenase
MKAMVIGLGRVGWSYSTEKGRGFASSHFGAYYVHNEVDTLVAVDSDKKRLAECAQWFRDANFHMGPRKDVMFLSNCAEAVRNCVPDIASVCVPTPMHADVMRKICHEHGPKVICLEKPLAPNLVQAKDIGEQVAQTYADHKRPKVAVNLTRRWDERYQLVEFQIHSGRIGTPLLALGLHPGPLLRTGIHMLDLFNWYLGEPDRLVGIVEARDNWMTEKFPETNDWSGSGIIRYKNGSYAMLANMGLNISTFVLFELFIYGDKGAIKIEDNGRSVRIQQIQESEHYADLKELKTEDHLGPVRASADDPMTRMVDDLVQCVKDPDRIPRCTIDDAIRAQRLVHMIRQCKLSPDMSRIEIMSAENVDVSETVRSR